MNDSSDSSDSSDSNGIVIDKKTILKICEHGTYYNPASNHYDINTNVMCDKCFRDNLNVSIGWKSFDLCLLCVNEINTQIKNKSNNTINQNKTKSSPKRKTSSKRTLRRMMQRQYKK